MKYASVELKNDKRYTFMAYEDYDVGDLVAVNTRYGYAVGTIVSIDSEKPDEDIELSDIVGKVDMSQHEKHKRAMKNVKIYNCDSDIGSVLVGNKDFLVALPNKGGDGTTTLVIIEKDKRDKDIVSLIKESGKYQGPYCTVEEAWNNKSFIQSIKGKFNIYSYDCSKGNDEDIVDTIEGRYGVYSSQWMVILERWE